MDVIEQIGSYAGVAAIVGLAVLSALYFSQARDVKRLREWAGRAPERSDSATPSRVVATPQPKPAAKTSPVASAPTPAAPSSPSPAGGTPAVPAPPGGGGAATPSPAAPPPVPGVRPAPVTAAAGARPATAAAATGVPDAPTEVEPATDDDDDREPAEATGDGPAVPEESRAGTDAEGDTGEQEAARPPGPPAATPAAERRAGLESTNGEVDAGAASSEEGEESSDDTVLPPATPAAQSRPPAPPPPQYVRPLPPRPNVKPRPTGQRTAIVPPSAPPAVEAPGRGRFVALAIVGLMIFGAGAVYAVTELTGDDDPSSTPQAADAPNGDADDRDSRGGRRAVNPANVTVAVLNGTTVPGLAKSLGDEAERVGFEVGTIANTLDQTEQRAESVVRYAPGHERDARVVGRRLGISQREAIDPDTQALAGDATVVVIAGADQTP